MRIIIIKMSFVDVWRRSGLFPHDTRRAGAIRRHLCYPIETFPLMTTNPAEPTPPPLPAGLGVSSGSVPVPEIDSRALLAGHTRIAIVHRGERYWLHATRAGKLLLTK